MFCGHYFLSTFFFGWIDLYTTFFISFFCLKNRTSVSSVLLSTFSPSQWGEKVILNPIWFYCDWFDLLTHGKVREVEHDPDSVVHFADLAIELVITGGALQLLYQKEQKLSKNYLFKHKGKKYPVYQYKNSYKKIWKVFIFYNLLFKINYTALVT